MYLVRSLYLTLSPGGSYTVLYTFEISNKNVVSLNNLYIISREPTILLISSISIYLIIFSEIVSIFSMLFKFSENAASQCFRTSSNKHPKNIQN